MLTLEPGEPRKSRCDDCGGTRVETRGYAYEDGSASAVYFAACYPVHREIWIDAVFGSWGDAGDHGDHVTFGCRYGSVEGQSAPACSFVPGGAKLRDSSVLGMKLDRQAALAHPWLPRFWALVDTLLVEEPTIVAHSGLGRAPNGDIIQRT